MSKNFVSVSTAVEGLVDEAVILKIAAIRGIKVSVVYGKRGKPYLKEKIRSFNERDGLKSF